MSTITIVTYDRWLCRLRRPQRYTRTDTHKPYTPRVRSTEKWSECPPTVGPVATPCCACPALFRFPACAPSRLPLRVHGDRTQEACQPPWHGAAAGKRLECPPRFVASRTVAPAPVQRAARQTHDRLLPPLRRHRHRRRPPPHPGGAAVRASRPTGRPS